MEKRRPKTHQTGRSKPDPRCKKHPKHRQSPGVCSVCLIEKLSHLSSSSSRSTITAMPSSSSSSSSSSLSSLSSSNASSYSSPVHRSSHRTTLRPKGYSISFLKLTKSRSMAFAVEGSDLGKKQKNGFWSNLLRPRSNKRLDDGLVHSKTMRERVTTRVH